MDLKSRRVKRKILYILLFFLISWSITSCEDLIKCKKCKLVSTDLQTGEVTIDRHETEYCGAALIAIEANSAKIIGNVKTEYVCR